MSLDVAPSAARRTPCGPSASTSEGTPSRSTSAVFHVDAPVTSDAFSSTVMRSSASLGSNMKPLSGGQA